MVDPHTCNQMYSSIIKVFGCSIARPNDVNLVFPRNDDCIVPAPLNILWRYLRSRVMLTQSALEIAGDYICLSTIRIESHELAIRRDADMSEGANV